MCVVCQGAVPHPAIVEIPLYVTLLQVGFIWLLGWWMIFKMKVVLFVKSLVNFAKKKFNREQRK